MNSNDEFDILKAFDSKEKVLFTFDGKNASEYWDFKIQGNGDATQLLILSRNIFEFCDVPFFYSIIT